MYITKETDYEILPDSYKYMAELIGVEDALTILKHFGGSSIYIPKIDFYNRHYRNVKIVTDYKKGLTYSQIATKYNLTNMSIRNIISSHL